MQAIGTTVDTVGIQNIFLTSIENIEPIIKPTGHTHFGHLKIAF